MILTREPTDDRRKETMSSTLYNNTMTACKQLSGKPVSFLAGKAWQRPAVDYIHPGFSSAASLAWWLPEDTRRQRVDADYEEYLKECRQAESCDPTTIFGLRFIRDTTGEALAPQEIAVVSEFGELQVISGESGV